jgi:hypothetical protein
MLSVKRLIFEVIEIKRKKSTPYFVGTMLLGWSAMELA